MYCACEAGFSRFHISHFTPEAIDPFTPIAMKHENILGNFYTTLLKSTVTLQHEKVKFQRNHRHLVRCRSGSHQHHGALDTSARGHRRDSAHPHRPVPAVHRDADWHQREAGEAAAGSGSASDGKRVGQRREAGRAGRAWSEKSELSCILVFMFSKPQVLNSLFKFIL